LKTTYFGKNNNIKKGVDIMFKLILSKVRPWLVMVGIIVLYLLLNVIAIVGFEAVTGESAASDSNVLLSTLIITQILTLLIVLFLYRRKDLKDFLRIKKVSLKTLIWSFVGGFGTLAAAGMVLELINFLNPALVTEYNETFDGLLGQANPILILISVVLLASIGEEVFMRGILFKEFEKAKYPTWSIVLFSGLIFGAFHLNLVQGAFATILGVAIALGFLYSGSLYVPILMHLGNNLTATLIGFLPLTIQESPILDFFLYSLIVLLPISLYMIYKDNK
jgi:uncharacterized protein